MPIAYFATVIIHVLAAFVWVGGMLFLALVGAPVLRTVEPASLRQNLFQKLGRRFRVVGWWSIAVLIVTGIINLHYRGWLIFNGVLGTAAFWRTASGSALAVKLLGVALMIVMSVIHDFIVGPAASREEPGSSRALGLRRLAAWLARLNALIGVVVIAAAIRVVRGG